MIPDWIHLIIWASVIVFMVSTIVRQNILSRRLESHWRLLVKHTELWRVLEEECQRGLARISPGEEDQNE